MNSSKTVISVALAAGLALAGCATGPETVEKDFGNSVRHMMQVQTANPSAPVDGNALDHGDGQRANSVMEAYRKDVGKPEEVKKEIILNMGDQ
jgi:type IV pilus biogenesis protein CpaD/CtpE